jgi:cytochrome P450
MLLHFIPEYLKRLVALLLFRDLQRGHKVAYKHIVPIIHHRRAHENDKDYKKPNDFLQWLLDIAVGSEATDDYLVSRILVLNFASVHTTTLTYTHAIYDLAVHTEYHAELREEIENLIAEEGWKKSTVMKMRKLDSFLKESTRIHSLGQVGSSRRVLKPYTFANGMTLPAGVSIQVPLVPTHLDENIYPNATEFDPLRFYRAREQNGENAKYYAVNTSNEYMHFGNGQHACPGRFFAVNEVKLMLAWTLLHYDFKTSDGIRPKDFLFEQFSVPHMKAEILFKRRS